jgi:hypothetical protein
MSIHFAFQWPVFGTVKKPKPLFYQEQSVYYWWFQYLRRNDDYLKTCMNIGFGSCEDLYKDFGDIHTKDFKTWWTANGARLFGEPEIKSIAIFKDGVVDPAVNAGREALVLSVPLDLPQSYLLKRFREILKKHHSGVRGKRHNANSRAMYPTGGKIDIDFLKTALQVWDMRKAEPDKKLWEIANDLKLGSKETLITAAELKMKAHLPVADKKNVLAATASRYIKKAQRMIDDTAKGKFPNP